MPEQLGIAAFVLGAVLLLASLLTGGFKIFGAEVSGTTGKTGRVLAFVLGLVFVAVGFGYHAPQDAKPVDRPVQSSPPADPLNAANPAAGLTAPTAPVATTNAPPAVSAQAPAARPPTQSATFDSTPANRLDSPAPVDARLPSGYGMQVCGCWGFNPRLVAPEPRCQSGYVRLNWCQAFCPAGGTQYAYVCQ